MGGLIQGATFVTAFKEGNDLEILSFFFLHFFVGLRYKNYGDVILKVRNSFFLGQINKFYYVFENCEKLAFMVLIKLASTFGPKFWSLAYLERLKWHILVECFNLSVEDNEKYKIDVKRDSKILLWSLLKERIKIVIRWRKFHVSSVCFFFQCFCWKEKVNGHLFLCN